MQVERELLQGFLQPRGGQVEADKRQGRVTLQQPLTLMAGRLCGQGWFLRRARVLVGLLSCLSPGSLAVVGKEMIPHQLAGGRLLKWSAHAMGPETGDGETDSKTATLAAIGQIFDGRTN